MHSLMQGRCHQDDVFGELLSRQQASGQPFSDPDFPAGPDAIVNPNDNSSELSALGPVNWRRPKDIPALVD